MYILSVTFYVNLHLKIRMRIVMYYSITYICLNQKKKENKLLIRLYLCIYFSYSGDMRNKNLLTFTELIKK